jgi:thiol-disulfide isomerase/thioredoxin
MAQRLVVTALACSCCAAVFAQETKSETGFKERADAVSKLVRAYPVDWPAADASSDALLRDYPRRFDAYLNKMVLVWSAELAGRRDLERKFASKLAVLADPDPTETPDWAGSPVGWAKGVIHRLDLEGQQVEIQFTAIDGRRVDLASMRGKVILVDFWASWCPPCLASLPGIKACFDKYGAKGFQVVGISWDNDQATLAKFVAGHGIPWPQHFEGPHRKLGEEFGIGGIPYMLLLDKGGRLRFASANFEDPGFASQVPRLLAE